MISFSSIPIFLIVPEPTPRLHGEVAYLTFNKFVNLNDCHESYYKAKEDAMKTERPERSL